MLFGDRAPPLISGLDDWVPLYLKGWIWLWYLLRCQLYEC